MARPTPNDYRLPNGRDAADNYEELSRGRDGVIEKARALSAISIPDLFPPEGYRAGDFLHPPNQSINARCIVNLASRIMLTALPPGQPILKYNIIEHKLQDEIDADPELYAITLLGLSRREVANRQRLEATNTRTAYVEGAMQGIIAGNWMWRHIDINNPSVHRMDTYVVKRNKVGAQQFNILKQAQDITDLDMATRVFVENVREMKGNAAAAQRNDDTVDIYCVCKLHKVNRTKSVWLYWEEFMGEIIPDTEVMAQFDAPPQYAAWMRPVYGQNWGNSYASLYEGDMYLVENNAGSINDGAEAAALVWLFVNPAGVTSKAVIDKAENLRTMHGNAADITVFRLEKNGDFQFVANNLESAARRLGQAFMMDSSIQRPGDRVTAEEWRRMARELDMAMGGLYASLSQGFGRNVMLRFLALQEDEDKSMPPLPEGIIQVGVITGMDAMGVMDDQQKLEMALEVLVKIYGPDNLASILNPTNLNTRVFAGYGVKPDGLTKDDAQQEAEKTDALNIERQNQLLGAAAPPIAKEGAKAAAQVITPAMVQAFAAANPNLKMGTAANAA